MTTARKPTVRARIPPGRRYWTALGVAAALGTGARTVRAAETGSPDSGAKPANASGAPTVEATFAFASAYVFRGDNVFQSSHQGEQNWVAEPRLVFTDASEKLSIGYGSAYQLTGDNIGENIDKGLGDEQIVYASYDVTLAPHIVITPEVGSYLYPFSPAVPLLLEASTEFWYVGPLEVGAFVGYLSAARPGPLTEDYVYISPRIVKSFMIGTRLEFGFQVIAGAKVRTRPASSDNTFDVLAAEYVRYSMTDNVFASLNWALAWTNLGPREAPDTHVTSTPSFADECAPFWGFALGADF